MPIFPRVERPMTTRLREIVTTAAPPPPPVGRAIAPSIHKISHAPVEEPPKPDIKTIKRKSTKEEKRAEKAALVSESVRALVESNPNRADVIDYFRARVETLDKEK